MPAILPPLADITAEKKILSMIIYHTHNILQFMLTSGLFF